MKKDLADNVNTAALPGFPKKKFLKALDPAFLEQRQTQLGRFFNAFLEIPEIAKSKLVLTYFASAAADQDSQDKIISLIKILQEKH